ncbi:MAG: hypothetical protein P9L94_17905 [Candidatus Hinthialibacter antarcticus]|nr:hypothetical protein [Candidatus Hinthialibacter antarcticus]
MSRQIPAIQPKLILLAAVPCLAFAAWFYSFSFGLVDDAYIPLVYARNFLAGHGIVFYPGGEEVEGFTSPFWFLLMALMGLFGAPLPSAANVVSLICGFLSLLSVFYIYRDLFCENSQFNLWPMLAAAALASDVGFAAWSSSGLETSLFALVLLWLFWLYETKRPAWAIFLCLLAASLSRPEAVLFIVPISIGLLLRGNCKKALVSGLIFWLLPLVIFEVGRYLYFGVWLPNTFYAKHDFGGLQLLHRGFSYLYTFLVPRPLLWIATLWLLFSWEDRKTALRWWGWIGVYVIGVVAEGGDHFALHRFFVPILPLWTMAAVRVIQMGYQKLLQYVASSKHQKLNVVCVVLAGLSLYAYSWQLFHYEDRDAYRFSTGARRYLSEVEWTKNWLLIGEWLKRRYPENTVIAVTTAGAIPYSSELLCIDIFGLNTREIAHTPVSDRERLYAGHEKSNPDYVFGRKPAFIQLFPLLFFSSREYPFAGAYHSEDARREWLESMLTFHAQIDLWNHSAFQEQYAFKTLETEHGFISIFERKDFYD